MRRGGGGASGGEAGPEKLPPVTPGPSFKGTRGHAGALFATRKPEGVTKVGKAQGRVMQRGSIGPPSPEVSVATYTVLKGTLAGCGGAPVIPAPWEAEAGGSQV